MSVARATSRNATPGVQTRQGGPIQNPVRRALRVPQISGCGGQRSGGVAAPGLTTSSSRPSVVHTSVVVRNVERWRLCTPAMRLRALRQRSRGTACRWWRGTLSLAGHASRHGAHRGGGCARSWPRNTRAISGDGRSGNDAPSDHERNSSEGKTAAGMAIPARYRSKLEKGPLVETSPVNS